MYMVQQRYGTGGELLHKSIERAVFLQGELVPREQLGETKRDGRLGQGATIEDLCVYSQQHSPTSLNCREHTWAQLITTIGISPCIPDRFPRFFYSIAISIQYYVLTFEF